MIQTAPSTNRTSLRNETSCYLNHNDQIVTHIATNMISLKFPASWLGLSASGQIDEQWEIVSKA